MNFAIRYLILVLIAFPGLILFYKIFSPLTIYPSYWLFQVFFDASLYSNIILLNHSLVVEIVPACVMGSAYYLLLILNLSIPEINLKKRIIMILTSFAALLLINILRILVLGSMYLLDSIFSDPLHTFFWYFLSIVFVLAIWFVQVRIFNIKGIPFYTDIKFLFKSSHLNKTTKKPRKKVGKKKSAKKKSVKPGSTKYKSVSTPDKAESAKLKKNSKKKVKRKK